MREGETRRCERRKEYKKIEKEESRNRRREDR